MRLIAILFVCALVLAAPPAHAADTTVSLGSMLGVGLEILIAAVATPLAALFGLWLQRQARRLGIEITDADRVRLDALAENGLRWAADRAGSSLDGKWSADLRSEILASAADYMLAYGSDTLARLHAPNDPEGLRDILLPRLLKLTGGDRV